MRKTSLLVGVLWLSSVCVAQTPASATQPVAAPSPYVGTPGDYVAHDFHFGTGDTLPELKLHYLTLGKPHRDSAGHVDNAVLLLHGTGGNAHTLLVPQFSTVLFGPGQPLDITHFFLIFPDDIGQGESSKPSDGLHMRFPRYDYDDMVRSQHQMLLDGLHVDHLRLILGTSMGCMQSFVWGETYPTFADALMPLACLPVQIAGRNRMMRYMIIENIKNDPAWNGGEYKSEPEVGLRTANELLFVLGSAPLVQQKAAPTRDSAEKFIDTYLTRATAGSDANNMIYYVDASRNYDPSANLNKITVPVMWLNSADDFINPPELGIAEKMVKAMPKAEFVLLPITDATRDHGTHTQAAIWGGYVTAILQRSFTEPIFATRVNKPSKPFVPGQANYLPVEFTNLSDSEREAPSANIWVKCGGVEPPTTLRQRQLTNRMLPGEPPLNITLNVSIPLPAGQSTTIRYDISALYDLPAPGHCTAYAQTSDPRFLRPGYEDEISRKSNDVSFDVAKP